MGVRLLRLHVKTAGLVHIGNGQSYGKKDYFARGGKIAVLDVHRFVSKLSPSQITRYCDFLSGNVGESRLQGFLDRKENTDLSKVAQSSILYQIDSPIATARRGSIQYHDVQQFIKDPCGKPYIPGSSIKGMLRTALLVNMLLDDAELRKSVDTGFLTRKDMAVSGNADIKLDKTAFWRERPDYSDPNLVNDIMRYVSVSDSEPLSVGDLVFAKKFDKFSKSDPVDHKLDMGKLTVMDGNELDVYRECLRPGTTVTVDVSVDERIDPYFSSLTPDACGLAKMLQRSFDLYSRRFLCHFDLGEADGGSSAQQSADGRCQYIYTSGPLMGMRCRNKAVDGMGFCNTHKGKAEQTPAVAEAVCYLGGGVDYLSKTVTSALCANDDEALDVVSHVLYEQFPTKVNRAIRPELERAVRRAGFDPRPFDERRFGPAGRNRQTKNDHRHWRDAEIGVSPHTMKWGIVGEKCYPMGKCSISIEEL